MCFTKVPIHFSNFLNSCWLSVVYCSTCGEKKNLVILWSLSGRCKINNYHTYLIQLYRQHWSWELCFISLLGLHNSLLPVSLFYTFFFFVHKQGNQIYTRDLSTHRYIIRDLHFKAALLMVVLHYKPRLQYKRSNYTHLKQ